jgi:hypothetical protein
VSSAGGAKQSLILGSRDLDVHVDLLALTGS